MKKLFNLILIILGVVLIVVCVDLTTNKLLKTDYNDLDVSDREAIAELCDMTELFRERSGCEEVWIDEYNLRNYKAVITRRFGFLKGYTYAVNMTASRNIFAQQIIMPEEYSDIAVYRFAYLTPFTFSLAGNDDGGFTDVNGERVYASVFDTQLVKYNGAGSLEEQYAKHTFFDAVESLDVPEKDDVHFEISEENVALTGLQYRILDDMMAEDSPEKLKELIREYVAVREYQNERDTEFAKYREQCEASEGCAQFAFYNISDLIGHGMTYFNKDRSDPITFYSAYYYLCTGRYNSDISDFFDKTGIAYEGAALCSVIADNELYENWQLRVDAGDDTVAPYTLLKRRCERSFGSTDKSIDDIKRMYNYEEIISMARTLVNEVNNYK